MKTEEISVDPNTRVRELRRTFEAEFTEHQTQLLMRLLVLPMVELQKQVVALETALVDHQAEHEDKVRQDFLAAQYEGYMKF